jgi:Na+-translocating ferredoxin:NAD+ oxidoreductase RnfG subunit
LLVYSLLGDNYIRYAKNLDYKGLERLKSFENNDIFRVYKANSGEIIQLVRKRGYVKNIVFLSVIKDSKIINVRIITNNESEDYGKYIENEWFLDRLKLSIKNRLEIVKIVKEKENEVVAVTGATISSQAMVDGINDCINNYKEIKNESK